MAWQMQNGYGVCSYAELAVQGFKRLFGNALKARELSRQKTGATIGASALNRITYLGMPVSIKIACSPSSLGAPFSCSRGNRNGPSRHLSASINVIR